MKKKSIYEECFINDNSCKGIIKNAHILSSAAVMKLLCGETNGGKEVIQLGNSKNKNGILQPKNIGWSKASAYQCFCDKHDNDIFLPIENNSCFDINNNNQVFLHSFRTFAYTYHKKRIEIDKKYIAIRSITNTINNLCGLENSAPVFDDKDLENNVKSEMTNFNIIRNTLIQSWKEKNYNELFYSFSIQINVSIPVASAGTLMAEIIDPRKTSIFFANIDDKDNHNIIPKSGIMFTVFPEKHNKTNFIFTALRKDKNALYIISKFEKLAEEKSIFDFTKAISGIILAVNKENSFMHPKMWEQMLINGDSEKLIADINSKDAVYNLTSNLWNPTLDLFSQNYTIKKLGITY